MRTGEVEPGEVPGPDLDIEVEVEHSHHPPAEGLEVAASMRCCARRGVMKNAGRWMLTRVLSKSKNEKKKKVGYMTAGC